MTKEKLENNLLMDIKADAYEIIRRIIDPYLAANKNVDELFSHIPDDEKFRYFHNVDWNSIIQIAISAASRVETYDTIRHELD